MANEPSVDGVVKAVQLARARTKYQGFAKGVSDSLLDIRWLLDQTTEAKDAAGRLDTEGGLLVRRYLEMEVPYRLQLTKEFLEAQEEAGLSTGELSQSLDKLESGRERLLAWVQTGLSPPEEDEEATRKMIEELASFSKQLDSVGSELERQAHDSLLAFVQTNKVPREVAATLVDLDEALDS